MCLCITRIYHDASVADHSLCACGLLVQDPAHLYFLFDLMPGGDLMDVLVSEMVAVISLVGDWMAAAEVIDC